MQGGGLLSSGPSWATPSSRLLLCPPSRGSLLDHLAGGSVCTGFRLLRVGASRGAQLCWRSAAVWLQLGRETEGREAGAFPLPPPKSSSAALRLSGWRPLLAPTPCQLLRAPRGSEA